MIELKLTFATYEEAADAMMKLAGSMVVVSVDGALQTAELKADFPEPAATGAVPKVEKPAKKAAAKKEEPKAELQPEPETAADGATMTEEEAAEYFKTQVRPALSRYMAKHGQDAARQFLLDYAGLQTKSLSSLPVEHYVAFVAACDKAAA